MKRPRIAVPEIHQDISNYTRAMFAAGIDPIVVSVRSAQLEPGGYREYMDFEDVHAEAMDALVLPGGGDIDPRAYGEENHGSVSVDPWTDSLQFRLLDDFVRAGKPVLGICRGMQVINVFFGGTLIQDLESGFVHMLNPRCTDQVHMCEAVEGSWIEKLYGKSFFHNSNHHQAVGKPGRGLVVDGRCPVDSVIESLHHSSLPIYAVQWHPERMCLNHARTDTVDGLKIFRFFCGICGGEYGSQDPYSDDPFRMEGIVSDGLGL